jgi:hypothetical protein
MQPAEVPDAGAATPAEARGGAPAAPLPLPPPPPPRSSPAPAPAPPPPRSAASGNHLLNFRSYAGPPAGRGAAGAPPPSGRRRPPRARPAPYDRAAFVHSNFRFLVSDAILAEARYREDPDLPLDWDDICLVETLAAAPPTCPIALAPLSAADAPVITPCGHMFSAAAIAAHLAARGGAAAAAGPCPLCFAPVAARELRLAAVRLAAPPAAGEEAAFALLRRRRGSILPVAVGALAPATASGSAPPRCDPFSKFTAVADPSALWAEAGAALAATTARLRAEGGSEAPGELAAVAAATEALAARARAWTERRARALLERAEDAAAAGPGPECAGRAVAAAVRAAADDAAAAAARAAGRTAAAAALDAAFPALAVAASPPRAAGWPRGGGGAAPAPPAAALAPSSARQPTSAPAAAPATSSSAADDDDLFLFQLADGQPVFLHPLNARMLAAHHGSFAACPFTVAARVLELEAAAQDEGGRRRLRALAHLPLGARYSLAEVDLAPLLPPAALTPFAEELAARAARRAGRARKAAAAARREAAAEAAARRAAARTGISAAELRAMPLPGEAAPAAGAAAPADKGEEDGGDGFEAYDAVALGASPGARGVSFAAIARDGFGATGPALGGPEAAPGGAALLGAWGARPAAPAPPPPGDAGGTPRRSKKGLVLLSSTQRRY